jgi:acylphosphatase
MRADRGTKVADLQRDVSRETISRHHLGTRQEMTNKGLIRRAFCVRGQVQNVGYRGWTREQARALGLHGSVRNLADGSVRVDAEGPPEALRRLHQLLHNGPPAARVTAIDEVDPTDKPLPLEFQITL